jgi:hypothetical protein
MKWTAANIWLKPIFCYCIIRWLKPTAIKRIKILPPHLWDGIEKQEKGFSQNKLVMGSDSEESSKRQVGKYRA